MRSRKISESLSASKEAHEQLLDEINKLKGKRNELDKQSNVLKEALGENSVSYYLT